MTESADEILMRLNVNEVTDEALAPNLPFADISGVEVRRGLIFYPGVHKCTWWGGIIYEKENER